MAGHCPQMSQGAKQRLTGDIKGGTLACERPQMSPSDAGESEPLLRQGMSAAEETLARQLDAAGIEYVREYRFAAVACGGTGKGLRARLAESGLRDWRFDFAIPTAKLAIEVEGGGWVHGRHSRGAGMAGDLRKYHAAMMLGWIVYRCDPAMVRDGTAMMAILFLCGTHSQQPMDQ